MIRTIAARRRRSQRSGEVTFPPHGKQGPLPGVDLDDTASLLEARSRLSFLPDVNVLIDADRHDSARHSDCRDWPSRILTSDTAFGIADPALSGFLRIVTHPRVFGDPTPLRLIPMTDEKTAPIELRSIFSPDDNDGHRPATPIADLPTVL